MNAKMIARILGLIALGLTIVPPILTATQHLEDSTMKWLMLCGCILWFASAPAIMKGGAS